MGAEIAEEAALAIDQGDEGHGVDGIPGRALCLKQF
jgi:hypothetical protein